MSCNHLLARNGVCRCGWRQSETTQTQPPPPEPLDPAIEFVDWSAIHEAATAELCRKSLARFVRESWAHLPHLRNERLRWNWHHDALCLHLQTMAEEWARARSGEDADIAAQRIKNLLINIAPGTTKTLITLVFFPAWMWTRWPDWSCRCVSSNPRAILESADYARTLVESDWYRRNFIPTGEGDEPWAKAYKLEPWSVRDDQDAKSDWGNTLGGFRRSTGLKAPVTGEHTSWILCDDPHDAEQVYSEAERTNVISKWDRALYNRVNNPVIACRVVVMQRLHALDLAAHILESPENWAHLVIASEFEPQHSKPTPIGWCDPRTQPGELLDPIRFPKSVLDIERGPTRLGTAGYNAQHQQRPDAESGMMFPLGWWHFFTVEGDREVDRESRLKGLSRALAVEILRRDRWGVLDVDAVCVSVDATFGATNETSSAVGLIIGAVKGAGRYILDDLTPGPRSFLQTVDDVEGAVKTAADITGKRQVRVLIEKKANGAAVLETMEKRLREGRFETATGEPIQVVFEAYEPGQNSKDSRAHAMEPDIEGGVLLVRDGAKWVPKFVQEFASFGGSGRNDRVDAVGQFLARYRKKRTWADAMRAMRAAG